jgi:hypothetical protein
MARDPDGGLDGARATLRPIALAVAVGYSPPMLNTIGSFALFFCFGAIVLGPLFLPKIRDADGADQPSKPVKPRRPPAP